MRGADGDERARRHAALSDPLRLAIVDELVVSDRSPIELRRLVGIESNLLAHHLDVLERAGLVRRSRSSGDARRRYVHFERSAFAELQPPAARSAEPALFVCTRNSARSQLAAALWRAATHGPAASAGTHPAAQVEPGAVAAARRARLAMRPTTPRSIDGVGALPAVVVTVCDQAHEELAPPATWWHWSIPDPVAVGTASAYDATVRELRERITALVDGTGSA